MPSPIAPNCQNQCPLIVVYPDGTESATYCEDCDAYLDQTVRDMNASRILADQRNDPSLS